MKGQLNRCTLCPRRCGADRAHGQTGVCGQTDKIKAARASLHMWEEPCISGTKGSGTVFFSGCGLRCVYCQNESIVNGDGGIVSKDELGEIFLKLQGAGAHNINLVTPLHFAPQIADAVLSVRDRLLIPVAVNCGGYELADTLKIFDGIADIYLPDFKYAFSETAEKYSNAPDYPEVAKAAVAEMVRQIPETVFDKNGIMQRGVIVRNLLLPGSLKNSKAVVKYLSETYGGSIILSLMCQYTPMKTPFAELDFKTPAREYEKLIDYAEKLGVKRAYIQDSESSSAEFIPKFGKNSIILDF